MLYTEVRLVSLLILTGTSFSIPARAPIQADGNTATANTSHHQSLYRYKTVYQAASRFDQLQQDADQLKRVEYRRPISIHKGYHSMKFTMVEERQCPQHNKHVLIVRLSNTNLTSVPDNILQNVTELYLVGNRISELPAAVFQKYGKMEVLDISKNIISRIQEDAFLGLDNLIFLLMAENDLNNRFETFSMDVFIPLTSLCYLDLRSNRLETLGSIIIKSKLKNVDISFNRIQSWFSPVEGAESIEQLTLFGNDCDYISENFFGNFTALQELNIGHNRLGSRPQLTNATFHNLTNLETLDMSSNLITTIPRGLFSHMTKLVIIFLSDNHITAWEARIAHLTKLECLYLGRNEQLRTLPQQLCHDLDTIQQTNNISMVLLSSELLCVCDTQYFVKWLTVTHVKVTFADGMMCYLSNGTKMALSKSDAILQHLTKDCRSYVALMVSLSTALVLVVCITIGGMVRRYRWKLRYLYYMAAKRGERTGYQRLDGVIEDPFAYDAFFSYEDSYRDFIRQQVLPKLETEAGLRLCIDKRDFTPGLYVTDNIMNAIQGSRKTVVLLSMAFLKSRWCLYELNMARMECIYHGRQTLVVVKMGAITAADLTAEVTEVLHSQSYIEKPVDPEGEELFWKKLVTAIQEP